MTDTVTNHQIDAAPASGPLGANQHLIGLPDARSRISTPALLLDLDVFEANIRAMADFSRRVGVPIRPHAKCHKSVEIARRQIAAGAVGVCCATIAEAEHMGHGGIGNILITAPLTTAEKIRRFCHLSQRLEWLAVVVDHPANVRELAIAARAGGQKLRVLVELDAGMQRTGVVSGEVCMRLVLACVAEPMLVFEGLQYYTGLAQHIERYTERREVVTRLLGDVRAVCNELRGLGHPPRIVTGGGTGTFDIDAQSGALNELQPGSYVFMDAQYQRLERCATDTHFGQSLFVQASVNSANHIEFVTVDAGLKQFAVDGGAPEVARGAEGVATFSYMGDEHGRVTLAPPARCPALGARIEFVIPHCDPTVNLYNHFHCFRGNALVDIWPVDARGS
jgi:3-hydroxy-D-aspartate aldolase